MAKLTTHVLDTAAGVPALGMQIDLFRLEGAERRLVKISQTNGDGRLDQPLLEGAFMQTGIFELEFHVGKYFESMGEIMPDPNFLGVVPVRFGIWSTSLDLHVPLLISPYGYSTYRGS
jgi:5-hydroxyisourate hydrolase